MNIWEKGRISVFTEHFLVIIYFFLIFIGVIFTHEMTLSYLRYERFKPSMLYFPDSSALPFLLSFTPSYIVPLYEVEYQHIEYGLAKVPILQAKKAYFAL